MFGPKTVENPLGRMALLAVLVNITPKPLIDDLGETIQLGSLDLGFAPIARRNRKTQHLPHALARYPKMTRRRAATHAITTGNTNLAIQFHGENPPPSLKTERAKVAEF
jgi:hypothetical protein